MSESKLIQCQITFADKTTIKSKASTIIGGFLPNVDLF